jgi:hypothetical protein
MKSEEISAMTSLWLRRFCFALMSIVPLLAVAFFQGRLNYYSGLLQNYECNSAVCDADFDGDGIPGKRFIDYDAPASTIDAWFVVEDSGRQLLRQPRRSLDTSLRTHAAVIKESPRARLIVYDDIRDSGAPRSLVFAYDGSGRMIQVPSVKTDKDVLAALASTDDAGTRNRWLLFQLVAKPALLCYLGGLAVLAYSRKKRTAKSCAPNRTEEI